MRKDMIKLVTERERRKSWKGKIKLRVYRDIEDAPDKEPIRRLYKDKKEFTDNISPLIRYLQSKIGCPWDHVYHEICSSLKIRTSQGNHIRDHVDFLVKENVNIIHGVVYNKHWIKLRPGDMYVHPESKLLTVVPVCVKKRQEKKKDKPPVRDLGESLISYEKIDGIWYEVKLTKMMFQAVVTYTGPDVFAHRVTTFVHPLHVYSSSRWYAIPDKVYSGKTGTIIRAYPKDGSYNALMVSGKTQLSKKAIKELALN